MFGKYISSKVKGVKMGTQKNEASLLIKKIMDDEGINQIQLAEKMGCTRQAVSQTLTRNTKSMRYDNFEKMIRTLGYEIIIKKSSKMK